MFSEVQIWTTIRANAINNNANNNANRLTFQYTVGAEMHKSFRSTQPDLKHGNIKKFKP